MDEQNVIAREILTDIIRQIEVSMIRDGSPLTKPGLTELMQRIILANSLLDQ